MESDKKYFLLGSLCLIGFGRVLDWKYFQNQNLIVNGNRWDEKARRKEMIREESHDRLKIILRHAQPSHSEYGNDGIDVSSLFKRKPGKYTAAWILMRVILRDPMIHFLLGARSSRWNQLGIDLGISNSCAFIEISKIWEGSMLRGIWKVLEDLTIAKQGAAT